LRPTPAPLWSRGPAASQGIGSPGPGMGRLIARREKGLKRTRFHREKVEKYL
jgi:hypothetical protein